MHRFPARISLLLLLLASAVGHAQEGEQGVRRPTAYPSPQISTATVAPRPLLGGFLGAQRNWSLGSFTTSCDCGYDEGRGFGAMLGALAEFPVSQSFFLLAEAGYRDFSTSYAVQETRTEFILTRGSYAQVDFERSADIAIAHVTAGLSGAWRVPGSGLYFFAGPRLGVLVSDEISERETVLTPGIGYASTQSAEKNFSNGSIDGVWEKHSLRFDAVIGAGFDIQIRRSVFVSPRLAFAYPFTSVVKEHPSWHIPAVELSAALLFAL